MCVHVFVSLSRVSIISVTLFNVMLISFCFFFFFFLFLLYYYYYSRRSCHHLPERRRRVTFVPVFLLYKVMLFFSYIFFSLVFSIFLFVLFCFFLLRFFFFKYRDYCRNFNVYCVCIYKGITRLLFIRHVQTYL